MQEKRLGASFPLEKKKTCLGSLHIHTCFWQSFIGRIFFNFSIAHYYLWTIKNCLSCNLKRWMQDQQCYTKAIQRLHCTCELLWIKINKGRLENWNWWFLRTEFRTTFSSEWQHCLPTWPCDNCKNEYVLRCLYLLYWDSTETIDSEMQFPNNGQGSNGKFCWKGKKILIAIFLFCHFSCCWSVDG